MDQARAPTLDPLTQGCHVLRPDAVLGEVLIVEAVDAAEHRGEQLTVEAGVGVVGEVAELIEGVATAGDRRVDVEEVASGGAVVQCVILPAMTSSGCRTGPMSICTGGWARQFATSSTRCCRSGWPGSVTCSRAKVSRRRST